MVQGVLGPLARDAAIFCTGIEDSLKMCLTSSSKNIAQETRWHIVTSVYETALLFYNESCGV